MSNRLLLKKSTNNKVQNKAEHDSNQKFNFINSSIIKNSQGIDESSFYQFVKEQFFKGYAASDSIYDKD